MAKRVVKQVPFSENVVKVIYEDGTFGLKSTAEGQDVPENQVDDVAASDMELQQAKQESNPMLKKYAEQLRTKYPNTEMELPQKSRDQMRMQKGQAMTAGEMNEMKSKFPKLEVEILPNRDPRQEFLELKPQYQKMFNDEIRREHNIDPMDNLKSETLDYALDKGKNKPDMSDYIETMKSWIEEKKGK